MSDYKLVNITDSTLEDIKKTITLPVIQGSNSLTYQTFNSQASGGNTQIQFNIQVPSLSTVLDRHVLLQSTIDLKFDITGGVAVGYWKANEVLFEYSEMNSLQAFPLNSLISTMMSNINNASVNVNSNEVMAPLLKCTNYDDIAKYNSMCPSLVDSFYQNYENGLGSNNNVLSNYANGTLSKDYMARGCFSQVKLYQIDGETAINGYVIKASGLGTAPFASFILRFTSTEPLLFLSPYIYGNINDKAGLLGINNMTLTLNIGGANRCFSNASYALTAGDVKTATISNVSFVKYTDAKLLMSFLSVPPMLYDKIESKNIVNYNQYTSYNYSVGGILKTSESKTFSFNNIQLNQVPSKFLIFARKSNLTTYDSNFFYVIKNVSINFGNKSGLLSSANQIQLYNMSVKNGLQMNFYEFSGSGISKNTNGTTSVPTIGSILVIDPAIDLSIDAQYSNMSSGQFNMQFNVEILNQTESDENSLTLYLLVVNSGLFITENGTSSFITGLLNQEQVLDTKQKTAILDKSSYENEIVGGSIENINSIHKHLKQKYSHNSEHEKNIDSNAGNMSAGSMSAGGLPKRRVHKYMK